MKSWEKNLIGRRIESQENKTKVSGKEERNLRCRIECEVRTPSPRGVGMSCGVAVDLFLCLRLHVSRNISVVGQRRFADKELGPRWCIAVRKPGIRRARWRLNGVKVSGVGNRAGTLGAVSGEEDRTWPRRVGGGASSKLRTCSSFPDSTSIYENAEHSPLFPNLLSRHVHHTRMMLGLYSGEIRFTVYKRIQYVKESE